MADKWRPQMSRNERLAKAVSAQLRGSLDGRIIRANPVGDLPEATGPVDSRQVPFTRNGELSGVEASPIYTVMNTGMILRASAIATVTSGDVQFAVYLNEVRIVSIAVTNSNVNIVEELSIDVERGDKIQVMSSPSGTASDAVVQVEIVEE